VRSYLNIPLVLQWNYCAKVIMINNVYKIDAWCKSIVVYHYMFRNYVFDSIMDHIVCI